MASTPTIVAELDMDIRSPETTRTDPRVHRIDCYDLAALDPARYAGLLVGPSADQEFLARNRAAIEGFLDAGRVVAFGGHLFRDWLPGAGSFVALEGTGESRAGSSLSGRRRRDFRVVEVADHPIFAGLGTEELTFRKGVAGFFARGHHPVPGGAEVLTRLHGGQPATYLDRVSSLGTILVHATADLRGFVGERLVDWTLAEAADPADVAARPAGYSDGAADPRAASVSIPAALGEQGGLAAVYGGSSAGYRALTTPKYARHLDAGLVYLPDLAGADLRGVDGLIVPERMHRGLLTAAADNVLGVLDRGGLVAAFAGGEPLPEFLPGVRWEHRPTNFWWWLDPATRLELSTPRPEHPLFDRLSLRDCTWHYHGALDPPDGAEVLVTLPTGEALLYLDRVSTPGTLVVSTLDPLSHFGGYFMPATERFLDGFLPWLAQIAKERRVTVPS